MRTTITLEKEILDDLMKETKNKNKASAVKKVIKEFLKQRKVEHIKAMKGKLKFTLSADEIRHYEQR
ncbi:MAG: DUF2191 domain-containing protein [Candidatus Marinimicrobia bacterium]|nr:DUF2191 domain-containing protein [Candidatus Neomarinimicrobiota bacterium]